MKITARHYATALYETLLEAPSADHDRILDNFVQILGGNGQLSQFEKIEKFFFDVERKEKGIKEVDVAFAREGHDERKILPELYALLGKNLNVKERIDKSLLGGVLVQTEDKRIDASVKKQLVRLKESLTEWFLS